MAHEYSVRIHDWISEKMTGINQELKTAKEHNDRDLENYCNGQLQELNRIRQYLTDKIDLNTQQYYH